MPELWDDAVRLHGRQGPALPTPGSIVHRSPLKGAEERVCQEDTACRHRDAAWSQTIAGIDHDPDKAVLLRDWAVGYHDALHLHSIGSAYGDFLMDEEGQERFRASSGADYPRPIQVERRYDPENVFRINPNIPPAPA